jgi:AAA15 family ATPase/GTPase
MIIKFSVQNFGPIKEKQTLSFEADSSERLENYYVVKTGKLRLLKVGLIYGANASGKTTVLQALDFLRDLVLHPAEKKTEKLDFKPYLFDPKTSAKNTILSIEFLEKDTRYFYEVEINSECILREELYYYPQKVNVFKRTTDIDKQLTSVTFGAKVDVDKEAVKALVSNTLWNNTILGGSLKTNIDQKEIKDAVDWFRQHLKRLVTPKTDLTSYATRKISDSEVDKNAVLSMLKKADLDISDILINVEENDIPKSLIDILEKNDKFPKEQLDSLRNSGKISSFDLKLRHTVNDYSHELPFNEESIGTQRYYGFACLLYMLINEASTVVPIDELESSLHPDLLTHFLLSFIVNAKQSQLIATTHYRELLNNKDLFRNDAIWFTDKSESSATELYSLADFDSSVIRDTSNILNAYKAGKLGGIPNLGDYYISLDHEAK